MNIIANHPLQELNSFGFTASAEHYVTVSNDSELLDALAAARREHWPIFLLGGGSNLVLTQDIPGLVIHQVNDHTEFEKLANGTTQVTAAAGKSWHQLVLDTLDNGLAGLENLSLIPGNTGAAPVQNIGAYGVELENRLHRVRAFHRPTETWLNMTPQMCHFSYRDSVFKQNPNDYVITEVSFCLSPDIPVETRYQGLKNALADQPWPEDNLSQAKLISQAVIRVRQSKLPDPKEIGNAGSFFKNPVVSSGHAQKLLEAYPDMVHYKQPDGSVKLAAGWMIDELGFRGHQAHGVGVHANQALVLVNTGRGNGHDLMELAKKISAKVRHTFEVDLDIEPVVV